MAWCLKIWAIWLVEGDDNTTFFHKFAAVKKTNNSIWELDEANHVKLITVRDLSRVGVARLKPFSRNQKKVTSSNRCRL